jgi:hypothetical protein
MEFAVCSIRQYAGVLRITIRLTIFPSRAVK